MAARASNEEELRIGIEKLLEPALAALGVETPPKYERHYITINGRSDAVYGRVVIEYEPVGTLRTEAGVKRTAEQLERYLRAESGAHSVSGALRRAVGVGLDGQRIFFLRYMRPRSQAALQLVGQRQQTLGIVPSDGFEELSPVLIGPFPIAENSVQEMLVFLRALRRRALTPEGLADVFGPQSAIARSLIAALYEAVQKRRHPKVKTFFNEWDRLFGVVYGQDLSKAERSAKGLGELLGLSQAVELKPLLFSIHTYYALLMKFLAAELTSLQMGSLMVSFVAELPSLPVADLQARLVDLEDGGLFARLGLRNFLEGDFFSWYLSVANKEVYAGIRAMARALGEFEPATGSLEPEATRDLLKKLYQYLVPRQLRHDLGEYYTPDWLAEEVLDEAEYPGDPGTRLLDPACGSGTFLVFAIRRAREYATDHLLEPQQTVRAILKNIVGFDLNPLAVIAARTNYLLALGTLVRFQSPLEVPVYLCDSILRPSEYKDSRDTLGVTFEPYKIPSTVGPFYIPKSVVTDGELPKLTALLEECIGNDYSTNEFITRARRELTTDDEATLGELYRKIAKLESEGRNGLWARIIKNSFAPVFAGVFDFVIGNPPWVNWQSLSDEYREQTDQLWRDYGLFSLSGHAARLGGGKKDLAMLMLYAAADHYLRGGGTLGFLITQTLLKTAGAGDGFRRFRIGEGSSLKVLHAQDMVDLNPFEGATNRTAIVVLKRGESTKYPVPYTLWCRTRPGRITDELSRDEVKKRTKTTSLVAVPVLASEPTSPWLTVPEYALVAARKVTGPSAYGAAAGATTWMNGIYWVRIISRRADGLLMIENLHDVGKTEGIGVYRAPVEADLLYPLLRGQDVERWRATPSDYILMPQDPDKRTGYDEGWLKVHLPATYKYLKHFEDRLKTRSGYRKYFNAKTDPFYSIYNVAEHTLAPHKVLWPEVANTVTAGTTVLMGDTYLGRKPAIPDHTLIFVPTETAAEADFICALLNSAPAQLVVTGYITLHPSPHILEHVAIPKFDETNKLHNDLAALGEQARQITSREKVKSDLPTVQNQIDELGAALWKLTKDQLANVRRALSQLR